VDINLRLDDGHQAGCTNLFAHFELLGDHRLDSCGIGLFHDGAHLGAKNPFGFCFFEQGIEGRIGLHQLHPVGLVSEALIDLENGHDVFYVPQIVCCRLASKFTIHGAFKQDGGKNPRAAEGGAHDNACAHFVHQREHAFLVGPGARIDAIKLQGLGGRTTALVERSDEARCLAHFFELQFVIFHGDPRRLMDWRMGW
jgi:hypothetical protein